MRLPCKEEREFMMDVIKKYHKAVSSFTVTDWGYKNHYDETPSKYGINIEASGLTDWAGKPLPDNHGVNYLISKMKLRKFMKENNIIKPSFPTAKIIHHRKSMNIADLRAEQIGSIMSKTK